MEAITREEIFLAKIIGETVPDIEPIVRKEMFLARIAGMDIPAIEPITREEMFLNAIANKEVIDLKPITRREMFLAKAMGADIEVPSPITRIEYYLSQLTGGGSGGGSYEKYSWEGVFASIDKGTYSTDYAIGDMIPLDLGSEGLINMQIVAFDTDDLADGSGKAPITWISKELLATGHRMNSSLVTNEDGTYQNGTGCVGGWEACDMRVYLNETIKPLMPDIVRNHIKSVSKSQVSVDTSGKKINQTTVDDVWIPAREEVYMSPLVYGEIYSSTENRIKSNCSDATLQSWWLRDSYPYSAFGRFFSIRTTGRIQEEWAYTSYCICLGFCT